MFVYILIAIALLYINVGLLTFFSLVVPAMSKYNQLINQMPFIDLLAYLLGILGRTILTWPHLVYSEYKHKKGL